MDYVDHVEGPLVALKLLEDTWRVEDYKDPNLLDPKIPCIVVGTEVAGEQLTIFCLAGTRDIRLELYMPKLRVIAMSQEYDDATGWAVIECRARHTTRQGLKRRTWHPVVLRNQVLYPIYKEAMRRGMERMFQQVRDETEYIMRNIPIVPDPNNPDNKTL